MKLYNKKNINYIFLSIYLVYFSSSLFGSFHPQAQGQSVSGADLFEESILEGIERKKQESVSKNSATEKKNASENASLEDSPLVPLQKKDAFEEYKELQDKQEGKYVWRYKPGLLPLVLLQREALQKFADPILESEAKPTLLFDELNYTYAENLSKLVLTIFWVLLILLCFIALTKGHWFYRPMSSVVFLISLLAVLYTLGTSRKLEIDALANTSLWPRIFAALELGLVFATSALLLSRTLPQGKSKGLLLQTGFMEHLRLPPARIGEGIFDIFRTIFHVAMLILASLALSNLLLLPLYKSQLSLQGIFVFLIVALLVLLAAWYIRAYTKLVEDQGRDSDFLSGLAFLGYRFIKNTLFITTIVIVVSVVFTLILILTIYNTSILQHLHLLPVEASL